jgi:hypothetical protein
MPLLVSAANLTNCWLREGVIMIIKLRAHYYRNNGRSEMDIHHLDSNGRPFKVETLIVASKADARRIAAKRGAIEGNF